MIEKVGAMIENRTKSKLQAGGVVVGCFMRYPVATFVELVAMHRWDFLGSMESAATSNPRARGSLVGP